MPLIYYISTVRTLCEGNSSGMEGKWIVNNHQINDNALTGQYTLKYKYPQDEYVFIMHCLRHL